MSLFVPTIHLDFTEAEWAILTRPIVAKRDGGFQSLLRRLMRGKDLYAATGAMELEDADLQRCYRYGYEIDSGGGYEEQFKSICKAAFREGWVPA